MNCGSLFGSTYICKQNSSIMKLNKRIQRLKIKLNYKKNLNIVIKAPTINISPDVKKSLQQNQIKIKLLLIIF